LTDSGRSHRRLFDCSVRVGSPEFDNFKVLNGERTRFTATAQLPVEDDELAIRNLVWRQTDRAWRGAAQRYIQIKARSQVQKEGSGLPEFTRKCRCNPAGRRRSRRGRRRTGDPG
jgi:hypothetical protein